jgi:hypothetical protein
MTTYNVDLIVEDAVKALNEIFILSDVVTIPPSHDIAARIRWHIVRQLKIAEGKKPAGRPRLDRKQNDMQTINNRAHWCSAISSEFVTAARCFWQILGLDDHGELWARVVDERQDFIGKPVKLDRRMKPKAVTLPQDVHYFSRPLRNHNDSGHAIRREMQLSTQGLF